MQSMKGDYFSDYAEFSSLETEGIRFRQNKIGLLGGTFNPIHNGHLDMAYIALYEFLLGEVIFLPLGIPPHKQKEYLAPPVQRLDMIKIAVQDEKRFSVNPIEINRKGTTYTVDTLEALTKKNKEAQFYFIIGADTLFELKTWKNFRRVIFLANFICILRPGLDEENVKQYANTVNEKYGKKIYLARDRGPNISSSKIRKMAAENNLKNGLVPEKVASYLQQNHIYCKEG